MSAKKGKNMKEVNKEPFIHLFSCSTGYYLYDVNTDSILKVTPDTYQRLEKRENIEENEQIRKLKKYGYLKTSHVQISEHPVKMCIRDRMRTTGMEWIICARWF